MAEAFLTGGAGNDTFTLAPEIDWHLLRSALLKLGVTAAGADQFLLRLPPSSEEDRGALQEGLLSLLKRPGSTVARCDCELLRSALLSFGVTFLGANQFIEWLPVSSPPDRGALKALLLGLTKGESFTMSTAMPANSR